MSQKRISLIISEMQIKITLEKFLVVIKLNMHISLTQQLLFWVYTPQKQVFISPKHSTRMFIVALLIMSKKAETANVHQQQNGIFFLYVHTIKSYIIMRKNEELTHSTIWLTLTDMLSERRLIPKRIYSVIPFMGSLKSGPNNLK